MHWKTLFALIWLGITPPSEAITRDEGRERPVELQERLTQAYLAKGVGYRPRTEHFKEDGTPRYINRLILEDSPYLLQHAHNPVDWHPWSDAAFVQAKRENKPVFLSIGYSTCHWCHVMERESFEDPAIAAILNQHFIPVKVDRESHPDVDQIYMTAVTLISGRGGWPMSSFLTPDGKPFYAGTYYPPDAFTSLLRQVAQLWREKRQAVDEQAERIAEAVADNNRLSGASRAFDEAHAARAVSAMEQIFDEIEGGFGQAPKFPQEPWLFLLLDQAERRNDAKAREMLTTTLDHMMRGGIYDQIGGGFHRYSTDYEWLVPHFEKMLYNQAHLSRLYLGAWRLTGYAGYRRVTSQTLDYVRREMTSPAGGFYSATDADSEGEEGLFFTWTLGEIRDGLAPEDAKLAKLIYNISRIGNFEGRNILHLEKPLEESARQLKMEPVVLRQRLDHINAVLLGIRQQRVAPLRDDKIVTAWNGMMITAFAEAAGQLDSKEYRRVAERAANFLWQHNRRAPGQLWRVHLDGRSSIIAAQEDYAYFAEGLLALYDLTGEPVWLARAEELADALLQRFLDSEGGGFFMNEAEAGITAMGRPRDEGSDGAIPSGTSVALRVLQLLAQRTDNPRYAEQADALIGRFAPALQEHSYNYSYMLSAIMDHLQGELGAIGYAAQGGIRLQAGFQDRGKPLRQLRIELVIASAWHVNSNQPGNPDLLGTEVSLPDASGWRLDSVRYPAGEDRQLGFQEAPVSLYTGRLLLLAEVEPSGETPPNPTLPVTIRLQACNDQLCLPPEQITLWVGIH
jgi:uncharacterized protein